MPVLSNVTLSGVPAGIPPPGISPNFFDPRTLAPTIIAVSIVMMIWAFLFVNIRLYANFHGPRGLGIDDYFCIVATVLAIAYMGMMFSLNEVARHTFDVPLALLDEHFFKRTYALTMIYAAATLSAKSTVLLVYLRVFAIDQKMKYCIWFGLIWNSLLSLIVYPVESYYCTPPIGKAWDLENFNGNKTVSWAVVQAVMSVAWDFYIFILPIPVVLKLQMSLSRRLSVLSVFGTAVLGIIAAVLGMIYRIKLLKTDDPFWAAASVYICAACEIYVAIIVGSMPGFASFFSGKMPGVSLLASMNSVLLKSRNGALSNRFGLSQRSNPGLSSGKFTLPSGPTRDKGYLELQDNRHLGESVRTEIRAEGALSESPEEGVVHKTVAFHQSTMQERPAFQG